MDEFWGKILNGLSGERKEIPKYVKNILEINGIDSMDTLSHIDDNLILELEEFVQTTMWSVIGDIENDRDYYNIFGKCKEKFKFVLGHKILLKDMGALAKKYLGDMNKNNSGEKDNGVGSGVGKKNRIGKINRLGKDSEKDVQPEDINLNSLIDSLYITIRRQLSKLKDEDDNQIKETPSTSTSSDKINGYTPVSILSFPLIIFFIII